MISRALLRRIINSTVGSRNSTPPVSVDRRKERKDFISAIFFIQLKNSNQPCGPTVGDLQLGYDEVITKVTETNIENDTRRLPRKSADLRSARDRRPVNADLSS
jgi:hypothetical protein